MDIEPKCAICKNSKFTAVQINVQNYNRPLISIQCITCHTPVAIMDTMSLDTIPAINKLLKEVANKLDIKSTEF